jgi:hypothetical protein
MEQAPFDIIPLPSEGILYPTKQKTVKAEFLTSMDESTLVSPNLSQQGLTFEVLLNKKIKDLSFDPLDMLRCDRMAVLIWLRITGRGKDYPVIVWSPKQQDFVEGLVDLSQLKQKNLKEMPDDKGEFSWIFPLSKKKLKFTLPTARDEKEISRKDEEWLKIEGNESDRGRFTLEETIKEIDGERDRVKILQAIAVLPLGDSIDFKRHLNDIEPGVDFNTTAVTPGGESVNTFLKLRPDFFLL